MATASSDGPIKISKRIEKELHQSKVVMRKLPPDLTEDKLLEALPDLPPYSYFYFAAGDPTLGRLSFSRAYFAFTDESAILPFRDMYDGMYLEAENGSKYRAVVEFAPYQGIPKKQKRKPDTRIATVEQDTDYQAFVEASEVQAKPLSMAELSAYIDTIGMNKVPRVQKTPLIDYLMDRRSGRSAKRLKSAASESKKRHGNESFKPARDTRKDVGSSRGKESRSKKEAVRESKDRHDKKKEDVNGSAKDSMEEKSISLEKRKEKSGRDKRGFHYAENGEVKSEGDRKPKEFRVKNKNRPDQAVYSSRGVPKPGSDHDWDVEGKESPGRSTREREGSHHRTTKENSSEVRGSGGRGREYGAEDKPRRGYGSRDNYPGGTGGKERRNHEGAGGRRGDEYKKSKEASLYEHHEK